MAQLAKCHAPPIRALKADHINRRVLQGHNHTSSQAQNIRHRQRQTRQNSVQLHAGPINPVLQVDLEGRAHIINRMLLFLGGQGQMPCFGQGEVDFTFAQTARQRNISRQDPQRRIVQNHGQRAGIL